MIQLSGFVEGEDIEIVFSGLRPGEKLYEELLNNEENTLTTHHPKIMIAKTRDEDLNSVKAIFSNFRNLLIEDCDLSNALSVALLVVRLQRTDHINGFVELPKSCFVSRSRNKP